LKPWLMSALTKSTENATPTASSSTTSLIGKSPLKFPDPPVFEGDPTKLEGWITQTCMYLRAYDIDLGSVRAVEVASMFLRGKALDWWSGRFHLVATGQAQPLESWDAFVKQLTEAFRPIELTRRYLKELLHISQGKSDMRSYIAAFNAARARVPGALSDEALCYVFLQGCRVDLHRPIIMQSPKTLDEHFSLAVSLADLSGSSPSSSKVPPKAGDKAAPKPICSHCKKTGHSSDQCYKLHPELKPKTPAFVKKS
jgi:Retrotransposon gag protein